MDADEFWGLVTRRDVTDRLAARPEQDITDFADHLARALHALDTPELCRQVGSDDAFLYARCAVVVAGRRTYERVLRKLAAFERYADRDEELLLTVAEEAYERATGRLWEHETPVGYETGSNTGAWGGAPEPVVEQAEPCWLGRAYARRRACHPRARAAGGRARPGRTAAAAIDEVRSMLAEVGARLRLTEPPPVPAIGVPDDLPGADEPTETDQLVEVIEMLGRSGVVSPQEVAAAVRAAAVPGAGRVVRVRRHPPPRG